MRICLKSWGDWGKAKNFPVIDPARHKVVSSPFRRTAREHRGLNLDKAQIVKVAARQLGDFVPQQAGSERASGGADR